MWTYIHYQWVDVARKDFILLFKAKIKTEGLLWELFCFYFFRYAFVLLAGTKVRYAVLTLTSFHIAMKPVMFYTECLLERNPSVLCLLISPWTCRLADRQATLFLQHLGAELKWWSKERGPFLRGDWTPRVLRQVIDRLGRRVNVIPVSHFGPVGGDIAPLSGRTNLD